MPIQDVGREENRMLTVLAGGAGVQALGGVAVIVLAIIGLSGVAQRYMLGVSAIVLGASLLAMSLAAAAEYRETAAESAFASNASIGGGAGVGVLGGISAVVLGILALLGIAPDILCAITAIVAGGALSISAGVPARLSSLRTGALEEESFQMAGSAGAGTQVLVGLAVIVLGVLAVVGIARPTLTLVAYLAAGAGLLVTGLTVSSSAASAAGR